MRRPSSLHEVLTFQADACRVAGSALYGRVLDGAAADLDRGGVVAEVLTGRHDDPFGSALALRLLGAVHRVVLEGRAPGLAACYPTAGGSLDNDPVAPFLDAVRQNRAEVAERLLDGVQTNEVGRSAALVGGYARVAEATGLPLRVLEIGASAGLNLRWDHYAYDTGEVVAGDPASPLVFTGMWEAPPPPLPSRFDVAERRGCDRNPLDPTSAEGRRTLLAYVWPDQQDRIDRLVAALQVAAREPAPVERSDAVAWLSEQLAGRAGGLATVVVHSIVMQYLPPDGRRAVRELIEAAGRGADERAPLAWLRMEPAGDRAEVRLTLWPGGEEQLIATAGYHGHPVCWAPSRA